MEKESIETLLDALRQLRSRIETLEEAVKDNRSAMECLKREIESLKEEMVHNNRINAVARDHQHVANMTFGSRRK